MKENQNIEWKETWRDDYLKWICGFANGFFRAVMIEAGGRGIELIMESCRSALVPTPLIRFEQTGLWVEFHFNPKKTETEKGPTTQEITQETTQEKIVSLLRSNPSVTRKALAGLIGLSEEGIKYHLNKLKLSGRLKRKGSTKAGQWEISE